MALYDQYINRKTGFNPVNLAPTNPGGPAPSTQQYNFGNMNWLDRYGRENFQRKPGTVGDDRSNFTRINPRVNIGIDPPGIDPNRRIGLNSVGVNPVNPAPVNPGGPFQPPGHVSRANPMINPYLNPNIDYGQSRNLYDSELSREYGEQNPQSEWTRLTAQSGFGGNNRKGQFGQNQYGKARGGFEAALLANPFLDWRGYLGQSNAGNVLNHEWLGASAGQRGLNPASRTSGVRWG